MTDVDTVWRLVCCSCQRCPCSHDDKLTFRSDIKRQQTKQVKKKTNTRLSDAREGENRQTELRDFRCFPPLSKLPCFPSPRLSCQPFFLFSNFSLYSLPGSSSSSQPRRLASLGSLLDDQHWHRLSVMRHSSHLNLTVDKHTEGVQIPAEFGRWDIQQVGVTAQR